MNNFNSYLNKHYKAKGYISNEGDKFIGYSLNKDMALVTAGKFRDVLKQLRMISSSDMTVKEYLNS